MMTPDESRFLLQLARTTVRQVVTTGTLPEVAAAGLLPRLNEPSGCFVTLTIQDRLRGCIGHIHPHQPLYRSVIDNARNAALRDSRFPPVQAAELDQLEVQISVLTVLKPLSFASPEELLRQLRPQVDGVVLRLGSHEATFLPQVWQQLPDKVEFLERLCLKAGAPRWAWREAGLKICTYQAELISESVNA